MYAQPFISKGTFSNVRELSASPRAADYDNRYQAYGDTAYTNHIGGFNFKQFRSNVVVRWEYRPGSTLFVVWSQGRHERSIQSATRQQLPREVVVLDQSLAEAGPGAKQPRSTPTHKSL